ncbi:MAG: hypothetical protein RL030_2151, partial [Pseudomonadota bacterium]
EQGVRSDRIDQPLRRGGGGRLADTGAAEVDPSSSPKAATKTGLASSQLLVESAECDFRKFWPRLFRKFWPGCPPCGSFVDPACRVVITTARIPK